jgi:hypothetical protein
MNRDSRVAVWVAGFAVSALCGAPAAAQAPAPTVAQRLGHPANARLLVLVACPWLPHLDSHMGTLFRSQLMLHLAYDDDETRGATWDHPDWGSAWRQSDFDLVRRPEFRDFLRAQGFVLVSWSDLAGAWP